MGQEPEMHTAITREHLNPDERRRKHRLQDVQTACFGGAGLGGTMIPFFNIAAIPQSAFAKACKAVFDLAGVSPSAGNIALGVLVAVAFATGGVIAWRKEPQAKWRSWQIPAEGGNVVWIGRGRPRR